VEGWGEVGWGAVEVVGWGAVAKEVEARVELHGQRQKVTIIRR
jgi:hypothetical protein